MQTDAYQLYGMTMSPYSMKMRACTCGIDGSLFIGSPTCGRNRRSDQS